MKKSTYLAAAARNILNTRHLLYKLTQYIYTTKAKREMRVFICTSSTASGDLTLNADDRPEAGSNPVGQSASVASRFGDKKYRRVASTVEIVGESSWEKLSTRFLGSINTALDCTDRRSRAILNFSQAVCERTYPVVAGDASLMPPITPQPASNAQHVQQSSLQLAQILSDLTSLRVCVRFLFPPLYHRFYHFPLPSPFSTHPL